MSTHLRLSRSIFTFACASALGLLTACGGGGGGGGGTSSSSSSGGSLALNSSNYQLAASEAASSIFYLTNTSSMASAVEASTADTSKLVSFAKSQLKGIGQRGLDTLPTGATYTQINFCDSGQINVSLNIAGSSLAVGDSATFTSVNCYDAATNSTYNGNFSITFTSLSGDYFSSWVYNIGLNMSFNNFSSATGSTQIVGNGSLALTENSTDVYSADYNYTAPNFAISATYGSTTYQRQLTNFLISQSLRPNSPLSTYKLTTSASGTVTSSGLGGGSVTVSTPTAFVQYDIDLYPRSGQAIATGSSGSKVRLTAQSSSTVLIELDANGDGTYETFTTKAWSAL